MMTRQLARMTLGLVLYTCALTSAFAGEADVIAATAQQQSSGTWTISATIRHGDEGWDHYADAFEVLGPDETVLGTRVLHHPHVEEQPFTRSLRGVEIGDDVTEIIVRARDSVHGFGGETQSVTLKRVSN